MISVIIPCTRLETIEKALDSVFAQTYKDIEIIVINDNPQKVSLDFLAEIDNRIIVINNEANVGLSSTRNIGINFSKGDYIYFLDDDDYLNNENALQNLLDLCEKNNTDIALTVNFSDENLDDVINEISFVDYYMSLESDQSLRPVSTKLYRRKYLINNGLYFLEGYTAEEDELLYRILINNPKVSVYNKKVYFYNQLTEGSIMKSEKYKNDKPYINMISRDRIIESKLDGNVKSKALSNIDNSLRKINGAVISLF